LTTIPVVILTTSSAESDMVKAYEWHASSYLSSRLTSLNFLKLMETFGYYWVAWNQYPHEDKLWSVDMDKKQKHVLLLEDEAAHVEAIRRALESSDGDLKLHVVGSLKEFRD